MRALAYALAAVLAAGCPASALSSRECSAKYKAAKADGSLGGRKWNEFRKAECGSDALEPATVPNPLGGGVAPATQAKPTASRPEATKAAPVPGGKGTGATFPKAVAPAYASEAPGKARFRTCLDQYNANKATAGNADMKWVEKGGGYYSACNARLKG